MAETDRTWSGTGLARVCWMLAGWENTCRTSGLLPTDDVQVTADLSALLLDVESRHDQITSDGMR